MKKNTIMEARKQRIPIVALVDTNANPELIDVVIPGNDDAIRAINLFTTYISDAIIEAKGILNNNEIKYSDKEVAEFKTDPKPLVVVEEKKEKAKSAESIEKEIVEKKEEGKKLKNKTEPIEKKVIEKKKNIKKKSEEVKLKVKNTSKTTEKTKASVKTKLTGEKTKTSSTKAKKKES